MLDIWVSNFVFNLSTRKSCSASRTDREATDGAWIGVSQWWDSVYSVTSIIRTTLYGFGIACYSGNALPLLDQHIAWVQGRLQPQFPLDLGHFPQALLHAASFATQVAHHHLWSTLQEDAGEAQDVCSLFPADGVWYPA